MQAIYHFHLDPIPTYSIQILVLSNQKKFYYFIKSASDTILFYNLFICNKSYIHTLYIVKSPVGTYAHCETTGWLTRSLHWIENWNNCWSSEVWKSTSLLEASSMSFRKH